MAVTAADNILSPVTLDKWSKRLSGSRVVYHRNAVIFAPYGREAMLFYRQPPTRCEWSSIHSHRATYQYLFLIACDSLWKLCYPLVPDLVFRSLIPSLLAYG